MEGCGLGLHDRCLDTVLGVASIVIDTSEVAPPQGAYNVSKERDYYKTKVSKYDVTMRGL